MYSCSRWCTKICVLSILSEILWGGGKINRPGQLAPPPPIPCQYITQLNVWSKHLRLTEIKFISLSTKYFWGRRCNKNCWLSILFEILGGGQDKLPWTAFPPPLFNKKPNWTFEVSISDWLKQSLYPFQLFISKVDDVIKIADYPFSLKFWVGGKINHPGQLAPHPLSIRNPTENLK